MLARSLDKAKHSTVIRATYPHMIRVAPHCRSNVALYPSRVSQPFRVLTPLNKSVTRKYFQLITIELDAEEEPRMKVI